jgi:hypothetical protein
MKPLLSKHEYLTGYPEYFLGGDVGSYVVELFSSPTHPGRVDWSATEDQRYAYIDTPHYGIRLV